MKVVLEMGYCIFFFFFAVLCLKKVKKRDGSATKRGKQEGKEGGAKVVGGYWFVHQVRGKGKSGY